MKSPNGSRSGSRKNGMGSASESQIFETSNASGASYRRRLSDSGSQHQSQSSIYHSTRSFEGAAAGGDEVSRYPYHDGGAGGGRNNNRTTTTTRRRRKKRTSPQRARSRSSDSTDRSLEFTSLSADSPCSSTDDNPRPVVAVGRLDRSNNSNNNNNPDNNLDRSHTETHHLDESAASLTLQESNTFPESYNAQPQSSCWNFAMEHRIFLKAVLELIAERDKVATEVGMNDPNVLKSGPLKKASHLMKGAWKVKYVEIRRGMFSYYEDAISGRHLHNSATTNGSAEKPLLRKNIPLEANACQCRAVRLHQKALNITPRGAIFELAISGRPKRLWMANSREERQAWIQAIHDAMVGGSVTRGGNPAQSSTNSRSGTVDSRSPHKEDVKKYQKVQGLLRNSKSKDDYVMALRQIYRYDLNVPVKWIVKQEEQESKGKGGSGGGNNDVKGAFHEEDVKSSVDQLFKDLQRDTIRIDDEIYRGNSGHAPERIMGALARRIMLCGRKNDANMYNEDDHNSHPAASKYDMTESQALAYARDVLLSGNRTRSGGDSYFCVNTLCKNDDLVVLVPSSTEAEPVSITVTRDVEPHSLQDTYAKSGWLRTRRRTKNSWVKAYFELSEGTLSYYEHALPRPHGLQGQLSILDANISIEREDQKSNNGDPLFVLTIATKEKGERQILLDGEEKMVVWAYALECTAKSKGGTPPAPLMKAMKTMMARMPKVPAAVGGVARRASMGAMGAMSGVSNMAGGMGMGGGGHRGGGGGGGGSGGSGGGGGGGERSSLMEDNSNKVENKPETAEAALKEHVANLGLDASALEERLAAYSNQQSEWVKASIEASTVYRICTLDPEGDENEDTWAVVDATFLQEFRVTGGPNPRILRGEEIVKVDVSQCSAIPASVRRSSSQNERIDAGADSPSRRIQMARLLRTFSDDVEYRGSKGH